MISNLFFSLDGERLEVVHETQLLGLTLTSDCRWEANTKNIVIKGNSQLWFLRRLKVLGANKDTLLDIYKLFCRSVLEYAAPVWSGSLNAKNRQDIERVQRNAFSVICGIYGKPYESLLEKMEQDTLLLRREKLSFKVPNKSLKREKFTSRFPDGVSTISGLHYFHDENKTKRFF